ELRPRQPCTHPQRAKREREQGRRSRPPGRPSLRLRAGSAAPLSSFATPCCPARACPGLAAAATAPPASSSSSCSFLPAGLGRDSGATSWSSTTNSLWSMTAEIPEEASSEVYEAILITAS
ncbi:hypothetical protein JRQ81_001517, partial [Phrynocephalus forsythii]